MAASLNDAVEAGFLEVLGTDTPEDLASFAIVPSKNYDPERRQNPILIVDASTEARRRAQPGAFDVTLKLVLISDAADDGDGATHAAAVAATIGHINGKDAVRAAINGASLHVYDYLFDSQATRIIETGEWETEIALNVVAQAR